MTQIEDRLNPRTFSLTQIVPPPEGCRYSDEDIFDILKEEFGDDKQAWMELVCNQNIKKHAGIFALVLGHFYKIANVPPLYDPNDEVTPFLHDFYDVEALEARYSLNKNRLSHEKRKLVEQILVLARRDKEERDSS